MTDSVINTTGEKDNNTKARWLAALVVQHRYNKNLGISYEQAVKDNMHIKSSIDFWIEETDR